MKIYNIIVAIIFLALASSFKKGYASVGEPIINTVTIPPAPVSASFLRVNDIPVNYATGQPIVNIELYRLKAGNVEIPISLSYNTSGVRVNDFSTPSGLGWSLNAGGGIFRTINGLADDEATGWLNDTNSSHSVSSLQSINTLAPTSTQWETLRQLALNKFDTRPDDFKFSFLGFNGDFKFSANSPNAPKFSTKKQLEVQPVYSSLSLPGDMTSTFVGDYAGIDFTFDNISNKIDSFIVYDYKGNKYTFSEVEGNRFTGPSLGIDAQFETDGAMDKSVYGVGSTGWKITQIDTYDGHHVSFKYDSYIFEYVDDVDLMEIYSSNCLLPSNSYQEHKSLNQLIKTIEVDDSIKVGFTYSTNSSLSDWKRQLDRIKVEHLASHDSIVFTLDNSVYTGQNKRIKLDGITKKYNNNTAETMYEFEYNPIVLPARNSPAQDFFGYYNNAQTNGLVVFDSNDNVVADRYVDNDTICAGVLEKIIYPTGGYQLFSYERNEEDGNVAPGLRILTTRTYSDGSVVKGKNFQYFNLSGETIDTTNLIGEGFIYTLNAQNAVCSFKKCYSSPYSNSRTNKGFYYQKVRVFDLDFSPVDSIIIPVSDFEFTETMSGYQRQPLIQHETYYKGKAESALQIYNEIELEKVKKVDYSYSTAGASSIQGVLLYETLKIDAGTPDEWTTRFYLNTNFWKYSLTDNLLDDITTTTYFDDGDSIQVVENYTYNEKQFLTQKQVTTSTSDRFTIYKYPEDIANNSIINSMKSDKMYDFVVQKVEKRGTAVIDDQIVTFGSFGGNYLPSKLYRRKNFTTFSYYNGTAVSANDYFEEVVFEDYDSFGNLEQYTTKDGITTTITYTGDGRFPASKQISNGTKSQTQYYNWNRLQGMTEYVDPTGVSIFYKYDGNGRLQHVENDDQRKVNSYEYHYGD